MTFTRLRRLCWLRMNDGQRGMDVDGLKVGDACVGLLELPLQNKSQRIAAKIVLLLIYFREVKRYMRLR